MYKKVKRYFDFIELAVRNYTSCLIVSHKNKCASVAIAIIYMLIKFSWSVHRTLEYINSKKVDIEMTKSVLK